MVILLGNVCTLTPPYGHAIAQAISRLYLIADARLRSQVDPCGIFGGQSAIGTGFLLVFLLYPVTFIPPLLHTISLVYHRRYSYSVNTRQRLNSRV
jgi:hypothetical protein